MQRYSVKIGEEAFLLHPEDWESLDLIEESSTNFHLIEKGSSFHIHLVDQELADRRIWLEVNGTTYEVQIENELDQLVEKLGFSSQSAAALSAVKAPMPGLILDVLVEEGQTVEKGTSLLILEAMKMENVIKATGDASVKKIEVLKGAAVEKGQVLIELE